MVLFRNSSGHRTKTGARDRVADVGKAQQCRNAVLPLNGPQLGVSCVVRTIPRYDHIPRVLRRPVRGCPVIHFANELGQWADRGLRGDI